MKYALIVFATIGFLNCQSSRADGESALPLPVSGGTVELSYEKYMEEVMAANLDYAAQRYNVSIAEAQLRISRFFLPNPQMQLGYTRDVTRGRSSDQKESDVRNIGLTQALQVPGKRRARIEVARHTLFAASASLEDFLRNLHASAANAFIDAQIKRMIHERKKQSADSFARLVIVNEHRLHAGDLSETDYLQSKVDARQLLSDTLSAQSDAGAALISLSGFLGTKYTAITVVPKIDLELPAKDYKLEELLAQALHRRPDIIAARELRDAAAASVNVAKFNRIPDVNIGLIYSRTGSSSNTVAPYEKTENFGPTVGVELPVFTRYHHEVTAARFQRDQAEKQLEAAMLHTQVDVRQAFAAYLVSFQRLNLFQNDTGMKEAQQVLETKQYSYEHGNSSLLELMEAQRALNSVYQAYYDALSDFAKARIGVEQAAGLAGSASKD